jgi:hypothetical protein
MPDHRAVPGGDDPALDPAPTSEQEERARRARITLAELVAWYVARDLPLDVELFDWHPEHEGRLAWGGSLGAAKAASTADRMRQVANLLVARGVRVQYSSGWESRGRPYSFSPSAGVIDHHTASATDIDSVLINGRSDLPGPLCHYAMHLDGTVVLIAAGYANHAGESVAGAPENSTGWGIEATGPWPDNNASGPGAFPQYAQYQQLNAAILEVDGWGTSKMWGHSESCSPPGRKGDPYFDMDDFRAGTAAGAAPEEDDGLASYFEWTPAEKRRFWEDGFRQINNGKPADGTAAPAHVFENSVQRARELIELARVGDGATGTGPDTTDDTHDDTSNEGIRRKLNRLASEQATQAEVLQQILDAVTAPPARGS